MNREVHVRFWESAGLRCPAPLNFRSDYRDLQEAQSSIRDFLEKIYNAQRLHSALGYLPPQSSRPTSLGYTRMPLRGSSLYEFSKASGNLSIR
jgi:transposase InsO family protein